MGYTVILTLFGFTIAVTRRKLSTAGTIAPAITWNNGGANTVTFPTFSIGAGTANTEYPGTVNTNPSCWTITSAASQNISVTYTVAGATGSPSTTAVATVELVR